jgi:hypothetical protein
MENYTSSIDPRKAVSPVVAGSRFTVRLASKETGETVEFDSQLMRVARMRSRVCAWASYCRHLQFDHKGLMKMVTLTYAASPDGVSAWRPHHISDFISKVRKHCGRSLWAYAWVAELQDRGEVHYHVLIVVQPGLSIPFPDKAGWWRHGMSRIETAHSPGYVVKYSQKALDEGIYPAGLHLFAVWVRKDLRDQFYNSFIRVKALPGWLHDKALESEDWPQRAEGGGWWVKLFGLAALIASPYVLLGFSKVIARSG